MVYQIYGKDYKKGVRSKRRKEKVEEGGRGGRFLRRERRKGRKDKRKGEGWLEEGEFSLKFVLIDLWFRVERCVVFHVAKTTYNTY